MVLGRLDDALDKLSQAFEIATKSKNPRDRQCWGTLLAQCYLLKGQLSEASEIMADIRQHVVPENDYYAAEVDGIITALRDEEGAARTTFKEALNLAGNLLAKTPQFYSVKFTRGLVLSGLAVLSEGEERETFLIQSQEAYHAARINCASPGVVADSLLLLNALQPLDKDGMLMQIKRVLRGIS